MDIAAITDLISNFGFPIACVIVLGLFAFYMVKKTNEDNAKNMEQVQVRCKEREDKLYNEIKENRQVNAKAIETIAKYAEKLDIIQHDVNDIKTDITIIAERLG